MLNRYKYNLFVVIRRLRWEEKDKKTGRHLPVRPCAEKGRSTLAALICMYTAEHDVVVDLCAGTLSTAATCLALNREWISTEIDVKAYYAAYVV